MVFKIIYVLGQQNYKSKYISNNIIIVYFEKNTTSQINGFNTKQEIQEALDQFLNKDYGELSFE